MPTVQSGGDLGFASIQTFGEDEGRAEFSKKAIVQQFGRRLSTMG